MAVDLEHSPADVLRQLAIDLGLAAVSGDWTAKATLEDDTPDRMVTFYDTTGVPDGRSMINGEVFDRHGFQVRVRAEHPEVSRRKIDEIRTAFTRQVDHRAVTVEDTDYVVNAVTRPGPLLDVGGDEADANRAAHTWNAFVTIRQLD
jgi:hypothetical protein